MPASSDEYVSPQLKGSIWCHQKTSKVGAYTWKEYLAVVRVSTKQCPSLCAEKNAVFYVDRSFHGVRVDEDFRKEPLCRRVQDVGM